MSERMGEREQVNELVIVGEKKRQVPCSSA